MLATGAALRDAVVPLTAKSQYRVSFKNWPRIGCADLGVLDGGNSPAALIELKWGEGTLFNCAWDVAKMAYAALELHVAAFLVAGAPAAEWKSGVEGSEFFGPGDWSSWEDNLVRYKKLWDIPAWHRPELLPKSFRTDGVAVEKLSLRGEPFELRCAEVSVFEDDWIDCGSGMSLKRWREHFSWNEGDVDVLTREEVAEILGGEENIGKPPA